MPISAKPRISEIFNEFGASAAPRLRDYVLGGSRLQYPGNPMNAGVSRTVAGLKLSQFAGVQKEVLLDLTGNNLNFNARTRFQALYGSPTEAVLVRVRVNAGAHVFNNDPNGAAFTVGSFPTGSLVILENNGRISGGRGVPNGGKGGDCLWNLTNVAFQVYNTGVIAPGGGGGGIGGTGGMGYFQTSSEVSMGQSNVYYIPFQELSQVCRNDFGSNAYCSPYNNGYCSSWTCLCYSCMRTIYSDNYTYGGGGGGGGFGAGCYNTSGEYSLATGGNGGGGPSGSYAGSGGTGGTGGSFGAAGATGNTGGSGNYTVGSSGGGGGAAGFWHKSVAGSIVLVSNTGTIYGDGANA